MEDKSALLVGASGLVGGELLKCLLSGQVYGKVVILTRKSLGINHPKLEEQIIDFDDLQASRECFKVDDVFCCLGTTIKKAKSKEAFKKVDVDYPLEMAKLARDNQATAFLIISAMGADSRSKVFYSRMKGLLEEKLQAAGMHSLYIFRPSLLLGNRSEPRVGEIVGAKVAKALSFIFVGPMKKYKPISAKTVASAMYKAAQLQMKGTLIYLSNEMEELQN